MTGTERKVFQKYYPPDFDPSKIPRAKQGRNRQFVQRVMAPFNLQCNTCGEYTYKGKKFNMRREMAEGEDYLGLKIFRFYFRCPNCLAEITFKTDLENCDYAMEHGATRLFEASKLFQEQVKAQEKQEEEDATNPMKMLEKRTKMSRNEMEALGKLEELQELNRRQAKVDYENMLERYQREEADKLIQQEKEDEDFVRSVFGPKSAKKIKEEDDGIVKKEVGESGVPGDPLGFDQGPSSSGLPGSGVSSSSPRSPPKSGLKMVKRLEEDSDEEEDPIPRLLKTRTKKELIDFSKDTVFFARSNKPPEKKHKAGTAISAQKKLLSGMVIVNKQKKTEAASSSGEKAWEKSDEVSNLKTVGGGESGGLSLLGGYASTSGSDTD